MKCGRCGHEAVIQEGHVIEEASGLEATASLTLKGRKGTIIADVCDACATMLRNLGWR